MPNLKAESEGGIRKKAMGLLGAFLGAPAENVSGLLPGARDLTQLYNQVSNATHRHVRQMQFPEWECINPREVNPGKGGRLIE